MPRKIALTGSHGVGKTTLATKAVQRLNEKGISVDLTPEVPRLICQMAGDPTFFRQTKNTVLKQTLLLYGQMKVEAEASQETQIVLCDRGVLDHWAYTKYFFDKELDHDGVKQLYEQLIVDYCRSYALIGYVPIEFPPLDDGTRESDQLFQDAIDQLIHDFLTTHDIEHQVIQGSLKDRLNRLMTAIDSLR